MKRASVYVFENYYLIHSQSTTNTGFGIASEPFIKMDRNTAINDVVNEIIFAMNQSKTGIVESANISLEKLLNAAGLKKHRDLYERSIHCMVYEKDSEIVFLPSINGGIKAGFKYVPKQKIEVNAEASIDTISTALEKTLSLCE